MISLCSVLLDPLDEYFEDFFIKNIQKMTKFVDEIIIAKVDAKKEFKEEKKLGNIKYIKFGCFVEDLLDTDNGIQHAIGIHNCINLAKNDLIFLSDPDVLLYDYVDEIYLNLLNNYKLNIIGCSHKYAVEYACGYYPNQLNMMFKKSDILDTSFFSDLIRRPFKINDAALPHRGFPGMWLIPGAIPEYIDIFPNKNGYFETGCNLFILGQRRNWKWLSFQTVDCFNYTTCYRRGNLKPLPDVKKTKLIYHMNNSWSLAKELKNIRLHNCVPSGMMAQKRYSDFISKFEEINNGRNN